MAPLGAVTIRGQRDFKSSVYRDWHTRMKLQWWAYLYARIIRVHIRRLLSTLYHAARFRWWRLLGGVGRKMQQHFEGGGNSRCGRFWGNMAFSWSLTCNLKVMGESSIEVFAIKNKIVYVSPTVHVSNKLTGAKYRYWNVIAAIDKQEDTFQPLTSTCMRVHSVEVHVKFCQAGSQVGIKTYGEQ